MLEHVWADGPDLVSEVEEPRPAGERVDPFRTQVDGADARRLAVRDVEHVTLQAEPRRLGESSILPGTVDERLASVSRHGLDGSLAQIDHRDLVRPRQRDVQLVVAKREVPGGAQGSLQR